ncbi:HAD-IIIA family hydrolase [bacterium]|nr:HAD-IIIA family hydrolase [bacterium]
MSSIQAVRSASAQGIQTNTPGKQRAVFMDRDGVFNEVDKHVNTPEQLDAALIPASLAAVAKLSRETDYKLIIVTNQGGVDAGFMTPEQNNAIQERLAQRVEEAGGRLDALYFCPNGKKFQVPAGEADGRKPDAGMFYHAAKEFGESIDLADSYMIGDMSTDIGAGEKAGTTTLLVKTGFAGKDGKCPATPDFIHDDLASAVEFILARG